MFTFSQLWCLNDKNYFAVFVLLVCLSQAQKAATSEGRIIVHNETASSLSLWNWNHKKRRLVSLVVPFAEMTRNILTSDVRVIGLKRVNSVKQVAASVEMLGSESTASTCNETHNDLLRKSRLSCCNIYTLQRSCSQCPSTKLWCLRREEMRRIDNTPVGVNSFWCCTVFSKCAFFPTVKTWM